MTRSIMPFRFGVVSDASTGFDWLRSAREAESRGYSTLVPSVPIDGRFSGGLK